MRRGHHVHLPARSLRTSAYVLACALGSTACGGLISLDAEPIAGTGGTVGGAPAGGGGSFEAGGTALSTGGTIASSGGTGGGGGGGGLPMCKPGEWLAIFDRAADCLPCGDGTFSTTYQATTCDPWTECAWAEHEVVAPTPSQDRVCEPGWPTRQFGTSESDQALDIVIDDRGSVFVSGVTYGSLDGPHAGDADVFLREYSRSGNLVRGRQTTGTAYESVARLAFNYGSPPYVLSSRWSPNEEDTAIWTPTAYGFYPMGEFGAGGTDFVFDSVGGLLLARSVSDDTGASHAELTRFTPYGDTDWIAELTAGDFVYASDIELLTHGDLIVVGTTNGPLFRPNTGIQEAFVARFSRSGDLVWGLQFGTPGWTYPWAVADDSADDVYIVGFAGATLYSDNEGMAARVSSDGVLEWMTLVGQGSSIIDFTDVAVDAADRVIAAGTALVSSASYYSHQDAVVFRILPDGGLGAGMQFGTPQHDWAAALAIAPDGAAFVVGSTTGDLAGPSSYGNLDAFIHWVPPEVFD